MLKDTISKVAEYKLSVSNKAELLIDKGIPEKIVELNELLETPMFNVCDLSELHQDLNIPLLGTTIVELPAKLATAPSNKPICDMVKLVRPILRQLVADTDLLNMWISFMIPKIEDGDNFGVSIQENTLSTIQSVETQASSFFDNLSFYFARRADRISDLARYPNIDDYRRTVAELDEEQYLKLWLEVCKVRNHYSLLHDTVNKNLEKLKKPRSSNGASLY